LIGLASEDGDVVKLGRVELVHGIGFPRQAR
jgi:hypothetical protein